MARLGYITRLQRCFIGILGFVTLASPALAGGDHHDLYKSAHYLGRGNTGISVASDHEAIMYNPAGIAEGKGIYKKTVLASPMVELSLATRDLYRRISVEEDSSFDALKDSVGKNQHLGIYNLTGIILRRAAFGAFISSQTDILVAKTKETRGLEQVSTTASVNQGLTFSLAESFFNQGLLMGITGKYLTMRGVGSLEASIVDAQNVESLSEDEDFLQAGTGGGLDFGLMVKSDKGLKSRMGLTVKDLGNTTLTPLEEGKTVDPIKQTVNVGFSIEPGTKMSSILLLLDYHDIASAYEDNPIKKLHMGAELSLKGFVGFTGGLNQGYATGGMFVDLYFLRVDAGAYTQEMGERAGDRPDPRFYIRAQAGF